MAVDARRDPASRSGAIARIVDQLGINCKTLRNWVLQVEVDAGDRPGTTTDQVSAWPNSNAKCSSCGGSTRS